MKLLYAEDERSLSEAVVDILTYHKFTVDAVYDGADALEYARLSEYDGIILDIMMPKMSGIDVLKSLRESGCCTPIMLLTAKSEIEDQVTGLNLGADDYLPKPFSMDLLIARIRAMLRRREEFTPTEIKYGNISLSQQTYTLSCGVQSVVLPNLEYRLMEALMLNQSRYLSTEELLCMVWGYETDAELGTVWVYLSYLRKRLQTLGANVEISVKRNLGYKLEVLQ